MPAELGQITKHSVEPTIDQSVRIVPAPVCVSSVARLGRSLTEVVKESGSEFGAFETPTGFGAVLGCAACRNVTCVAYADKKLVVTSIKTHLNDPGMQTQSCAIENKK